MPFVEVLSTILWIYSALNAYSDSIHTVNMYIVVGLKRNYEFVCLRVHFKMKPCGKSSFIKWEWNVSKFNWVVFAWHTKTGFLHRFEQELKMKSRNEWMKERDKDHCIVRANERRSWKALSSFVSWKWESFWKNQRKLTSFD